MHKIIINIINFFYNYILIIHGLYTIFLPEWFFMPVHEQYKNVTVCAQHKKKNINITPRFVYMLYVCNHSAIVMRYWAFVYCFIWLKENIFINNKKFTGDYPFGIVDLDL